jgi:hypothetical protein
LSGRELDGEAVILNVESGMYFGLDARRHPRGLVTVG